MSQYITEVGIPGIQGPIGVPIEHGTVDPTAPGTEGLWYLNTTTGKWWVYTSSVWTLVMWGATQAEVGQPNGIASLDGGGKIPQGQIPAIAINETYVVASQAAMLALAANVGDVAVRTDISESFILGATPASNLANWHLLLSPPPPVSSVAGKTGAVTLVEADVANLVTDLAAKDALGAAAAAQAAAIAAAATDATTKANAAVTTSETYTDTQVATETTNRTNADTTEVNARIAAVAAEAATRAAADTSINGYLAGLAVKVGQYQYTVALESGVGVARDRAGTIVSSGGATFAQAFNSAQALLPAGGGEIALRLNGTVLTDPLRISGAGTTLTADPGTTLKLKNAATEIGGELYILRVTANDVKIDLPATVLDFNKANQDQTGFNAAGGSNIKSWHGIIWEGTDDTHRINGGYCRVYKIINVADRGYICQFADDVKWDVTSVEASSGAGWIQYGKSIEIIRTDAKNLDNTGWKTFPHFFDAFFCDHPRVNNLRCKDQMGSGVVANGTTLSDWNSGVTVLDCVGGSCTNWELNEAQGAYNKGVGISLLGNKGMKFSNIACEWYSEVLLEDGGNTDCEFTNVVLDGHYNSVASDNRDQHGHSIYNNSFYRDFSHRTRRYSERNKYTNFTVQRCVSNGLNVNSARNCKFVNYISTANRFGAAMQWLITDGQDDFIVQFPIDITGLEFHACEFSFNEWHGFFHQDGSDIKHFGTRFNNNGQSNAYPTGSRKDGLNSSDPSGYLFNLSNAAGGGVLTKTGVEFSLPQMRDTQNALPANLRASASPSAPTILSLSSPSAVKLGQTIKLTGAGAAGADLITRINDFDKDEITVDDPILTFATVAGTGTITSTGKTVVGAGTAFTGQFQLRGRFWITAGGQTRQVNIVTDDTHLTVDVAFSPDVVGTAFTIIEIPVVGIPSQNIAMIFSTDTISPKLFGGQYDGNIGGVFDDHLIRTLSTRPEYYGIAGVPNTQHGVVNDRRIVTGDYNIQYGDDQLAVQLAAAATCTLTLPDTATFAISGHVRTISDEAGTASQWTPIIIVDGVGNEVVRLFRPWTSVQVYYDGANWRYKLEGPKRRPESVFDILMASNSAAISDGFIRFSYFTAEVTESITKIKVWTDATPATWSGTTLCRLGIYPVNSDGSLGNLIASSVNDVTKLTVASTPYTFTLSSTFAKKRGVRYAVGMIIKTGGTAPTIKCVAGPASVVLAGDSTQDRMNALMTGQTDLPGSVVIGSLGSSSIMPYMELLQS